MLLGLCHYRIIYNTTITLSRLQNDDDDLSNERIQDEMRNWSTTFGLWLWPPEGDADGLRGTFEAHYILLCGCRSGDARAAEGKKKHQRPAQTKLKQQARLVLAQLYLSSVGH